MNLITYGFVTSVISFCIFFLGWYSPLVCGSGDCMANPIFYITFLGIGCIGAVIMAIGIVKDMKEETSHKRD